MSDWSELYPEADAPLGVSVGGDEFENPMQPWRGKAVAQRDTAEQREAGAVTRRNFMRDAWSMSPEEIAAVEAKL